MEILQPIRRRSKGYGLVNMECNASGSALHDLGRFEGVGQSDGEEITS